MPGWTFTAKTRRTLRVRARISWHLGASAGRADARRRDAGDVVTSSRIPSGARDAPRRAAVPMHADYYSLMIMFLLRMGTAAKCQVILARAQRRQESFPDQPY